MLYVKNPSLLSLEIGSTDGEVNAHYLGNSLKHPTCLKCHQKFFMEGNSDNFRVLLQMAAMVPHLFEG